MSVQRALGGIGVLIGAVLLASGVVRGQQQIEGEFAEELEVVEVLLDVLVTDGNQQVVIGLGPGDFEVRDKGELVALTSATFYSSAELIGDGEALQCQGLSLDEIPQDRYFILFFQNQRRAATQVPGLLSRQFEAIRELESWIESSLQPRDWLAIATFETRLEIVQDFTRDLETLRQGLARSMRGQGPDESWPSRQPEAAAGPALLTNLPSGRDLGKRTGDIYKALEVLAEAAGGVRGRKVLVFLGRGIGEVGPSGVWEPDSRYFEPMVETLNDNNVAVYPLDLVPLEARHTLEQSLFRLADQTGGTFSRQYTSFRTPLERISRENSGYYLLGYPTRFDPSRRRYHQVRVRTRNPELEVRARRGYLTGD